MTTLEPQTHEARETSGRDVRQPRANVSHVEETLATSGTDVLATVLGASAIGLFGISLLSRGAVARTFRSAVLGAAGGVVAGYAMNQVHALWSSAEKRLGTGAGADRTAAAGEKEPATVKAAQAVRGPLPEEEKAEAGSVAHFATAAVTGAIYGMARDRVPAVAVGRGLAYGAAVWLAADELVVPALRLSGPPWQYPPRMHARALFAHLVFGVVLDSSVRLVLG